MSLAERQAHFLSNTDYIFRFVLISLSTTFFAHLYINPGNRNSARQSDPKHFDWFGR